MIRGARVALATTGIALAPAPALACPTCFSANASVLPFYIGTALLLSFLPLVLVGSILLWLRHRMRSVAAGEPTPGQASPDRSPAYRQEGVLPH